MKLTYLLWTIELNKSCGHNWRHIVFLLCDFPCHLIGFHKCPIRCCCNLVESIATFTLAWVDSSHFILQRSSFFQRTSLVWKWRGQQGVILTMASERWSCQSSTSASNKSPGCIRSCRAFWKSIGCISPVFPFLAFSSSIKNIGYFFNTIWITEFYFKEITYSYKLVSVPT